MWAKLLTGLQIANSVIGVLYRWIPKGIQWVKRFKGDKHGTMQKKTHGKTDRGD